MVDDDKAFREAAAELLSRGFEVAGYAGNEDQAVVTIQQLRPDAVLLDIRLPGSDGFEVARRLSSGDDAPTILLTSSDPDKETCNWPSGAAPWASWRRATWPVPTSNAISLPDLGAGAQPRAPWGRS